MSLTSILEKLRSKKQESQRTANQRYLHLVEQLTLNQEVDQASAEEIISAVGVDWETELPKAIETKTERFRRHQDRQRNHQAIQDRISAERDLRQAQAELNDALQRLQPAVDNAAARIRQADHICSITAGAEDWLLSPENVLDKELLQREQQIFEELKPINAELAPLQADRSHKRSSLLNAEHNLESLRRMKSKGQSAFDSLTSFFAKDADEQHLENRIADLESQIRQLDEAIAPREREQSRLRTELEKIREEKLRP